MTYEAPPWDGDSSEVIKRIVKEIFREVVDEFESRLARVLAEKFEEFDGDVREDEAERLKGYPRDWGQ